MNGIFRFVVPLLCLAMLPCLPTAAAEGLDDIFNYRQLSPTLSSAGQIKVEQIADIEAAGFDMVINLAVADAERNQEEGYAVAEAGLAYAHIPVDAQDPTAADLDLFFGVLAAAGERRVLVHCFANHRSSVFTYLYRVLELGEDEATARRDLDSIWSAEAWQSYPQWAAFVEQSLAEQKDGGQGP